MKTINQNLLAYAIEQAIKCKETREVRVIINGEIGKDRVSNDFNININTTCNDSNLGNYQQLRESN